MKDFFVDKRNATLSRMMRPKLGDNDTEDMTTCASLNFSERLILQDEVSLEGATGRDEVRQIYVLSTLPLPLAFIMLATQFKVWCADAFANRFPWSSHRSGESPVITAIGPTVLQSVSRSCTRCKLFVPCIFP